MISVQASGPAGQASQQQRACVFCGATPVTKEHVWPQWLSREDWAELLHRAGDDLPQLRLGIGAMPDGTTGVVNFLKDRGRSASVARHVVKAACASCNNGWMAALEAEAKPVLLKYGEQRHAQLTEWERTVLCRWLLKSAAVFEVDDPYSAVLPVEARAAIMDGSWEQDDCWGIEAVWVPSFGFRHNHVVETVINGRTGERRGVMLHHQTGIGRAGFIIRRVIVPGDGVSQNPPVLKRSLPLWPEALRGVRPAVNDKSWLMFGYVDR